MAQRKEKVFIDVITTEDGNNIYAIVKDKYTWNDYDGAPDCCMENGWFTDEQELEVFLDENKESLTITKDYRTSI